MFDIGKIFDSTMDFFKSDAGSNVLGSALSAGGSYLANSELQKQAHSNAKDLAKLNHSFDIENTNLAQRLKDERNAWSTTPTSGLGFTFNDPDASSPKALAGNGILSSLKK
ncbi:hypothetical protein [Vibrio litoralis]|uniref:hypothetical protein n=1 Tax=Vibrio litoralis TaxID=335972 RepID=UPI000420F1EF|nr:hypothetical protein [Vibrio litoralis]